MIQDVKNYQYLGLQDPKLAIGLGKFSWWGVEESLRPTPTETMIKETYSQNLLKQRLSGIQHDARLVLPKKLEIRN